MRIDIHTHAFHTKLATKFVSFLSSFYACECKGDGSIASLEAAEMEAGMDRYVVLNAAPGAAQVIPANNLSLSLRKDSSLHAIPFGTIHPDYTKWEEELNRLEQGGIRALKIHPNIQGFTMDDPSLFPLFEACSGRFLILFHVGSRTSHYSSPKTVKHLVQLFPQLDIIAAHFGGWRMWEQAAEVYKDIPIERLWFDTSSTIGFLSQQKELFAKLMCLLPPDRYLFGTDWPITTPREEIIALTQYGHMSEATLEKIMTNAESLLSRYGML